MTSVTIIFFNIWHWQNTGWGCFFCVFTYSTVFAPPSWGTITFVRPLSVEAGAAISTDSWKLHTFIGVYKIKVLQCAYYCQSKSPQITSYCVILYTILVTCKLQTILHYYRFHTKVQGIHLDRHRKMTPQYCNKWLRSSRDFSYTHLHLKITNEIHMFMYVLIVSTASHRNSIKKNTTNQYF